MDWLAEAELANFSDDLFRNIVSIKHSQALFDDLSDSPAEQAIAVAAELAAKPPCYGESPIINRPFEEAQYRAAIGWPFEHWSESRYSTGRFGVWYGASDLATTVHETVHHWLRFLSDAGFDTEPQRAERKIYRVHCEALLLDLRGLCRLHPGELDGECYTATQALGQRLVHEGHPGLLSRSARGEGDVGVIFNAKVLSNPRPYCFLSYWLLPEQGAVRVLRGEELLMQLPISAANPSVSVCL